MDHIQHQHHTSTSPLSSFLRSRSPRTVRRPIILSDAILGRYPVVVDVSGQELRIDAAGVVFQGRFRLYDPPDEEEVVAAHEILTSAKVVRSLTLCSYRAKAPMERLAKRYLSNGAVIVGAHRAGIRMGWIDGTLNVRFALSRVWMRGISE